MSLSLGLESHPGYRLWALAMVHHALGNRDAADLAVRDIEAFADGGSFQIAEVHAARGAADNAFEWLERAFAQRDGGVAGVKASVHLRSLHGDPRWSAFLQKMGL